MLSSCLYYHHAAILVLQDVAVIHLGESLRRFVAEPYQ